MINGTNYTTIPYVLSNSAQEAYDKIKALIIRIFSLLKKKIKGKNLKDEFFNSYIDFARKLDEEGLNKESYSYMAICEMYYDLLDRPNVLIAHERFFIDLFNAFDELLFIKKTNPDEYWEKYNEFIKYRGKMQQYYYTRVAINIEFFDEEVLKTISGHLTVGLK